MSCRKKIPIVFAFDDNYALPASIALKSLMENKHSSTEYEVIVFYSNLKTNTIKKIETICPVRWVKINSDTLSKAPVSATNTLATYYRLLIADLLPEYDKVIWSDVDVLFLADLSDIYSVDMQGADWGGIRAEIRGEELGVHTHFPENKKPYVYMPGFMLINTKQWRKKNMLNKFLEIIHVYDKKLRMFDLDVLNLAADKIMDIPFNYCVLENIWDADSIEAAPEYPWLVRAQGKKALVQAKKNPIIIHYAGNLTGKIWQRAKSKIPTYYWRYIIASPFYKKNDYEYTWRDAILYLCLSIIKPFIPSFLLKRIRKKIKAQINHLKEKKG